MAVFSTARDLGRRVHRSLTAGERWPASREIVVVEVTGRPIRVQVGSHRVKPELDDVAGAPERTGLALHEVSYRAEEARRRIAGPEPGTEP